MNYCKEELPSKDLYIFSNSRHRRCSFKKDFNHWEMFFKIGILKNFANFAGKHLCLSLSLIKLGWNFMTKRLQHRCFPAKFAEFLRAPILKNIYQRLISFFRVTTMSAWSRFRRRALLNEGSDFLHRN